MTILFLIKTLNLLVAFKGCYLNTNLSSINNSMTLIIQNSVNKESCFQLCRSKLHKFSSFQNNSICLCHDSLKSFTKDSDNGEISCDDGQNGNHYELYYKGLIKDFIHL